jgi:putative colanic acid biosynthesis acetyltransferase WcaF
MKGLKYYSMGDYAKRAAWMLVYPMFRWSPRLCFGWRNAILRLFGARIATGAKIFPSVAIAHPWNLSVGADSVVAWHTRLYNLGQIEIGERVVISQHAHLCAGTHDYEAEGFPLQKSSIRVEDDVWIAADAFIGPGVRVGRGAVVGARAVVVKDVPPQVVVAGNPARVVKERRLQRQL